MQTITLRLNRDNQRGLPRLELRGQRLLVGPADTGIFRIVAAQSPSATAPQAQPLRRSDDDGLASAAIEIADPLAVACDADGGDPYNRRVGSNYSNDSTFEENRSTRVS